jgi:hypothetical protein
LCFAACSLDVIKCQILSLEAVSGFPDMIQDNDRGAVFPGKVR